MIKLETLTRRYDNRHIT